MNRNTMSGNSKVSVITICWNCADEIEETVLSVINQDYPDIEYIVIDGASTDGTKEIVRKYINDIDIFVSEKDKGVYNAMNKGVERATGQWCIFMNGGDRFASEDVVSKMFAARCPAPETKVYYGNTWKCYKSGKMLLSRGVNVYPTIKRCQPYIHQSAFFNIEDKKSPFYDESYRIASDYNTSLWYYKNYGKKAFEYVDTVVSIFKNYDGLSTLNENQRKEKCEYIKIWGHYPFCWKKLLAESIRYFILHIQPFVFLKNMLKKHSEMKMAKNGIANSDTQDV